MNDVFNERENSRIPSVDHPSWQRTTAALLEFVRLSDRRMEDIVAWGRDHGNGGTLTRHMLAWLSFKGHVHFAADKSIWRAGQQPPVDESRG